MVAECVSKSDCKSVVARVWWQECGRMSVVAILIKTVVARVWEQEW